MKDDCATKYDFTILCECFAQDPHIDYMGPSPIVNSVHFSTNFQLQDTKHRQYVLRQSRRMRTSYKGLLITQYLNGEQ